MNPNPISKSKKSSSGYAQTCPCIGEQFGSAVLEMEPEPIMR